MMVSRMAGLGFAFLITSASATITVDQQARDALLAKNYPLASDLATQIIRERPESAINWYRLAIASTRMSNKEVAEEALKKAKAIDPTLYFASSPQRVELLERSIQTIGLSRNEAMPPPGPLPAGGVGLTSPVPLMMPPPSLISDDVIQQEVLHQEMIEIGKSLLKVNESIVNLNKSSASEKMTKKKWILYGIGAIALGFIGFLGGYFIEIIGARARKRLAAKDDRQSSRRPLQEIVETLRDDAARLVQRLEMHGHSKTELYAITARLLPALEREVGRSRVNVPLATKGELLQDMAKRPEQRIADLGNSSPGEAHLAIAKRLAARSQIQNAADAR